MTLLPGVDVLMTRPGQPAGRTSRTRSSGGCIVPSSLFPTGSATPLLAIGTSGAPTTNPCGVTLDGLCLNGIVGGTGSTYAANCVGLLVTDTADVHVTNAFLGNFDRPGGTGLRYQPRVRDGGQRRRVRAATHSVISAS